jgi:hypothetical protein
MRHAPNSLPPESPDFAWEPSFNVVIAYEDLDTGKHAKRTYDLLVEKLEMNCEFNTEMWKFDVLGIPKLRHIAAQGAAAADIVLISCRGEELPPHVKLWIESWLSNKTEAPLALMALFESKSDGAAQRDAVRAYLADVARRGHMEFFAHQDEWLGCAKQPVLRDEDFQDPKHRTLSMVANAVLRSMPVSG